MICDGSPQDSHSTLDTKHLRRVSAEPISTAKTAVNPRGSQSVEIKGAARNEVTYTIDNYETWTAARAALSAKKRKEQKHQSNGSTNSVSALRHLCSNCQVFPLEACIKAPEPGCIWTSPLKRLIWHKNDCPLCSLLIRSLCEPENDPFKHPKVFLHLPAKLRAQSLSDWLTETLAEDAWVDTTTSWDQLINWPFGLQTVEARSATGDIAVQEAAAQGFNAIESLYDGQASPAGTSRRPVVLVTLPCYVTITNNPLTAGLLDIQFWGYGRTQKAPITALSSFRLRIESDDLLTAPAHIASGLTYGRIVDPSQIDLSMGRLWLDHCEQNHGACCSKQGWPFRLGRPDFFRLIDVEDLSIMEVSSPTAWSYRYLMLSYVRGGSQTFKLLQNNKQKLMRPHGLLRFFRHGLSKTLRDAINVTRGFEERYIWIDSLCIEQDNEQDRQKQIDMMDRIVGNAVLTIVAADAENADAGLRGVERGSRHVRQVSEKIQPNVRLMLPLAPPRDLNVSPWAQRAWTFQERLFSRRIVYFSGDQIYWRCHKCSASEDLTTAEAGHKSEVHSWLTVKPQQLGIKSPTDGYATCSLWKLHDGTTHVMRSATFREYAQLIRQYTKRQQSHNADTLNAIAGLLHVFETCFKGPMRQGLPQVLLDAAVLWRPAERLERRDCTSISSWSWAGWKGEIKYTSAFRVEAKKDWTLHRVASETGQEWFRPLLRWYIWQGHELKLLNGNGFGVPIEANIRHLPDEWDKYPPMMSSSNSIDKHDELGQWDNIMEDIETLVLDPVILAEKKLQIHMTDLPQPILRLLGPQHLIFRTSCSRSLRFGKVSRFAVLDPTIPLKYPLRPTTSDKEAGSVRLDGTGPREFDPERHEFVILSEALYLAIGQAMSQNEKDTNFPLYNVMLIEWKAGGHFASRLGLGRIYKETWKSLDPPPIARTVILD